MFRERCKQALWQMPALIVMAGLIALGVNYLRNDGIALVGDWSVDTRFSDTTGDSMVIDLKDAGHLFDQDAAVFLDARPRDQYALGHIRGALSIPWQEVDRYFNEAAGRLKAGRVVITYCDGETCDLSHELALFLKDMGFDDVRILVNGWTVWQQAGLPTQKED